MMYRFLFQRNKGWKKIKQDGRQEQLLSDAITTSSTTDYNEDDSVMETEEPATPTTASQAEDTKESSPPLSPEPSVRLVANEEKELVEDDPLWIPFCAERSIRHHSRPLKLRRSLSHGSFSTITTAAETPPNSTLKTRSSNVIEWADDNLKPRTEIDSLLADLLRNYPNAAAVLKLQTQSSPPAYINDDNIANCAANRTEGDDGNAIEDIIPGFGTQKSTHPPGVDAFMTQNFGSTLNPRPILRRTHSGGLDPYLRAPDRFTRFEI